jgi:hypothetical protein
MTADPPPPRRWQHTADEVIELQPVVRDAPPSPPRDRRPLFYLGKAPTVRGELWYECGAVDDRDGYLLYCRRLWRWHRGPHDFASGFDRNVRPGP